MCSAHGTLRGHRQPIVGTANPLPIYGHYSPLIASAALVPIVGCVELRMGTSVALAMGTRWFIFARAFAQRRQTRKGHGARGTGVARATQASIHPMLWLLYGLLYQASVLRPRALKPEEAWPQQGQHAPNFKNTLEATARNTTYGGPPPGR